jgi:DNA-binding CsgD family transcriptional regulator
VIYVKAECSVCHRVRTLYADDTAHARKLPDTCRECWLASVTKHPPQLGAGEPDWAAVERLIAGQPVRATAADRKAAVEHLTRRGQSGKQNALRIGCSGRTVQRWRRSLREAS